MLTRIQIESENSITLHILGVTTKASLLVRKITGLNPPDQSLFIGDYARDGGIYQGRRVGNRNVVMTLDLNPNPALGETVQGLRERLYKAFIDPHVEADYLKMTFYDDSGRIVYLVGYAEKFETEIFDVETMVQVSIICPDPYLRDEAETVHSNDPGWSKVPFTYTGTAETGFDAFIKINAPTPTLTLANNPVTDDPNDPAYHKGRMIINHDFATGETVRILTTPGSRNLQLNRLDGSTASLINALTPRSTWLQLHSQSNNMSVYGADVTSLPASIIDLRYVQAYWGA